MISEGCEGCKEGFDYACNIKENHPKEVVDKCPCQICIIKSMCREQVCDDYSDFCDDNGI